MKFFDKFDTYENHRFSFMEKAKPLIFAFITYIAAAACRLTRE